MEWINFRTVNMLLILESYNNAFRWLNYNEGPLYDQQDLSPLIPENKSNRKACHANALHSWIFKQYCVISCNKYIIIQKDTPAHLVL